MIQQISKDTKFKDLPDDVKIRLIKLYKIDQSVGDVPNQHINMCDDVMSEVTNLGIGHLKSIFDQCVSNIEAVKEGKVDVNFEDGYQKMERWIRFLSESMEDNDILELMYDAVLMLESKARAAKSKENVTI